MVRKNLYLINLFEDRIFQGGEKQENVVGPHNFLRIEGGRRSGKFSWLGVAGASFALTSSMTLDNDNTIKIVNYNLCSLNSMCPEISKWHSSSWYSQASSWRVYLHLSGIYHSPWLPVTKSLLHMYINIYTNMYINTYICLSMYYLIYNSEEPYKLSIVSLLELKKLKLEELLQLAQGNKAS